MDQVILWNCLPLSLSLLFSEPLSLPLSSDSSVSHTETGSCRASEMYLPILHTQTDKRLGALLLSMSESVNGLRGEVDKLYALAYTVCAYHYSALCVCG